MAPNQKDAVKLLVTIAPRGKGDTISAFLNKKHGQASFLTMGVGTAGSEIMAILGLDSADKDVIFSLVSAESLPAMMSELSGRKLIKSAGNGIAFSLRLTGISSLLQAALTIREDLSTSTAEGETPMEKNDNYSLVLAVADPGYTDVIMELAKSAGATGGTVLYARGMGHDNAGKFLGIRIQAEKEIVIILTPAENRLAIMKAINEGFGIRTETQALVFSLPVEDMVQVS